MWPRPLRSAFLAGDVGRCPGAGSDRRGRARARSPASSSWTMSPRQGDQARAEGIDRARLHEIVLARNDHRRDGGRRRRAEHGPSRRRRARQGRLRREPMQLSDREASQSAGHRFAQHAPSAARSHAAVRRSLRFMACRRLWKSRAAAPWSSNESIRQGERYRSRSSRKSLLRGKFYDLAKARKSLTAGGTYTASLGSRRTIFRIDPRRQGGSTPIVGRLLRLE